jgi:Predicted signal-transduction protein containing cAMP-binding and CBS domains
MTVANILRVKGSNSVETIGPDRTVADAAGVMSARRIGALVVSADGRRVDGLLSERDVVRVLGTDGPSVLQRPISDIMTRKVSTCAPSDRSDVVMGRMSQGGFRHMPVVEDGALVGMISIRDVIKARLEEMRHENTALMDMIQGY